MATFTIPGSVDAPGNQEGLAVEVFPVSFTNVSDPGVFDTDGQVRGVTGSGTGTSLDPWTAVEIFSTAGDGSEQAAQDAKDAVQQASYNAWIAANPPSGDPTTFVFSDGVTEGWAKPITDLDPAVEYQGAHGQSILGSDIVDGTRLLVKETDGYRYRIYEAKTGTGTTGEFEVVKVSDETPWN